MRRITSLLVVFAVICIAATASADEKAVKLFNGKNLEGWGSFAFKSDAKIDDIWSVKDGVMVCKGEPLGYLYTKQDYDNYKLTVEWRWPDKPGNSGILLRIAADPVSFLPKCAEAQLKAGSAGDIYGFYGCTIKGPEDRFKIANSPALGEIHALPKIKAAEKKPGEWNTAEVTVDGGTITVVVNGEEINQATDCNVASGRIGLQSEGGEIHFRTVELVPITK